MQVAVDLNYNKSAALTDAHVKKCNLHTEADNCCHAVIHRLEHSKCNRCNIACERPRSISILAGCIQRQMELSQLCPRLNSCDTTDDGCNGGDLFTVFNFVKDAGSIDCIDNDADYPESSYRGCSGDYYVYYYGSEQALR